MHARHWIALTGLLIVFCLGCGLAPAQEDLAPAEIAVTAEPVPAPKVPADDPYEAAFQRRAQFFIRQTARRDTDSMIRMFEASPYFKPPGGDPHKYALPPVIAKLYMDPTDEAGLRMHRWLIEVDKMKGDKGLYHFATFQQTRLFFQLKDKLPDDIRGFLESNVKNNFGRLVGNMNSVSYGTENHTFMSRASAFPWGEHLGATADDSPLHKQQQFLRGWILGQGHRFYTIGMGEYDSSTYVGFSLASLANVHDFAQDAEMRLVARAMMDWLVTAVGRKYFHGCQLGPEARGFAAQAVGSLSEAPKGAGTENFQFAQVGTHTDWCLWVLVGGSDRGVWMDRVGVEVNRFPALNLALSGYRVHPVLRNIALKNVPLPYEARGSKPSYTGDNDNKDHEILYFNSEFAMGTLYSPEDGVRTSGTILPQTTMFKVLARGDRDVVAFGASNGYHGHFPLEGRSPYDQYHQKGAAALNIAYVNADEDARTRKRSLFGFPVEAGEPVQKGGWYFWKVRDAYVAARPLNGKASLGKATKPDKEGKMVEVEEASHRFLVSPGELGGWAVQAGQKGEHEDFAAFQQAVLDRCKLDLGKFASGREVSFTSLTGDVLRMRHTGGPGGRPDAWTNGEKLVFEKWPVYDSPYVKQDLRSGILRLSDGKRSLTIDFSGKLPKYTEGVVEQPAEAAAE